MFKQKWEKHKEHNSNEEQYFLRPPQAYIFNFLFILDLNQNTNHRNKHKNEARRIFTETFSTTILFAAVRISPHSLGISNPRWLFLFVCTLISSWSSSILQKPFGRPAGFAKMILITAENPQQWGGSIIIVHQSLIFGLKKKKCV